VARANFLDEAGDIDSAQLRIRPLEKPKDQPFNELGIAVEAMKNVPWTTLQNLKGDSAVLKKLEEAEILLKSLRKALT
jgi:ParB family chromosome partitioning protein